MSHATGVARVVGTLIGLRIADVSKRAGVVNPRSYVELAVESVEPPELAARLGARASLISDDKVELAVGTRVEVVTHVGGPPGRLQVHRLVAL